MRPFTGARSWMQQAGSDRVATLGLCYVEISHLGLLLALCSMSIKKLLTFPCWYPAG